MMQRPIARRAAARPLLALVAGFFGVVAAVASARPVLAPEEPVTPSLDVVALFHTHCASCHGETGDGKGWTELDRPARSFKDGGFSFGNTAETIARTITGGIPGTPMPGFDAALSADEIAALAKHVIALGPPELPKPERTEMIVLDRPLVARGKLPPIVRGAPERPRGLLVGTLDGLTFEYDAEDVRLVGVRQGRFVDRRDWGDRGGAALEPLGKPVYVVENGKPRARYAWRASEADEFQDVKASLVATRVVDGRAAVVQALRTADGRILARVEERPRQLVRDDGSGFLLAYVIEPLLGGELLVRFPVQEMGEKVIVSFLAGSPQTLRGAVVGRDERCVLVIRHPAASGIDMALGEGARGAKTTLTPGRVVQFDIACVLLTNVFDTFLNMWLPEDFDR